MSEIKNWTDYKESVLDGLSERDRQITSQLVEQSHSMNINALSDKSEANSLISEDATGTNAISRYDTMFIPMITRMVPALLANKLVGVQPIDSPRGIVRSMKFTYGEDIADADGTNVVTAGEEASNQNLYQKYSKLAAGDNYDIIPDREEGYPGEQPYAMTQYLESDPGRPMNMEVLTKSVEPMSRKLRATYTLEAADDLESLDGLDIEAELNKAVGDEILREKDKELLDRLMGLADNSGTFDYDQADGRFLGEKLNALVTAIDTMSTDVATKLNRSGATWCVVSPNVFVALKHSYNGSFVPAAATDTFQPGNTAFVGTLGGTMAVYVNPYAGESNDVLVGYKSGEMDTGLIYAPYIPMQSSGVVVMPETGDRRLMLRTRYSLLDFTDPANSLGNSSDFYNKATVSNLKLGFTGG